ncbi:MAG: sigma-54 dependent transcriptional regulator [Mariprofundus sp.]|nr:sigma-54 dependent transcriptional regulator [Mariprofundus sp.]
MTSRILIVDDEQAICESMQGLFEDEGYLVTCAASGEEALARLRKQSVDCVLLDIWMPGIDGLETLNRMQQLDMNLPVIMMSGHATIDTAVKATRQGAFDFVEKPVSFDRLSILARNAVQKKQLKLENVDLKRQELRQVSRQELIGQSKAIRDVRSLIGRVALSDSSVLLLGEHGTEKEVAARLLHGLSKRQEKSFVDVNTASIQANRMDSELFGHEKGAFSGALHSQRGRFEMAHMGTLFFDEITELSLSAQAKILHVMQQRSVQHLGNPALLPCNVRLIAASAADLEKALLDGQLREDFYYHLNVVSIRMPSLRERLDDMPLLVSALSAEKANELGGKPVALNASVIDELKSYHWPGNMRELRNYIERCQILMPGLEVDREHMLPFDHACPSKPSVTQPLLDSGFEGDGNFHQARDLFERQFLLQKLEKHEWNISRTAADIGMERSQLHRKIKSFGLVQVAKESL